MEKPAGRDRPYLTVVVPAYNEEKRIGPTLHSITEYLAVQPYNWELVVVDDGSRDNTVQVVNKAIAGLPNARLIAYTPNRGKGAAVRTGVVDSLGETVLFTDADLSTPIAELEPALRRLNEGADLVIGSRGLTESLVLKRQPLYRQKAARIFNKIIAVWLRLDEYADTQCGFKLFKGPVARFLFGQQVIDGFMFDVETLFLARKFRLKVTELPVRWINSPDSRLRIVRDTARMFRDLARIRIRHLRPALRPAETDPVG